MPVTPQPRPSGKKPACVLSRNPVPPPAPEICVVGSRVHRLLHDARAAVRAQDRPDTPLTAPPPPRPLPRRSSRPHTIAPLPLSLSSSPLSPALLAPAPPAAPVASVAPTGLALASSAAFDATFVAAFVAVRGNAAAQLEQLNELKLWLSRPQRALWDAAASCLLDALSAPAADAPVTARVAALLLRHGPPAVVPAVARSVHELCQAGLEDRAQQQRLEHLLLREALLQPLLCLVAAEETLHTQPAALWDVLEALRRCSASSETILLQLVSLGLIPIANALVKRILASTGEESSSKERAPLGCPLLPTLLPPVCLLYRNLSKQYAQKLLKLGSLDRIVDIMNRFRGDVDVVQAAARAMAKTAFEECCLEHYRSNNRAARAVVAALDTNLEEGGLVVNRLCGTLTRLVEHSRELRDWLMHHHSKTLVRLVRTHAVQNSTESNDAPNVEKVEPTSELAVDAEIEQNGDMLKSVMCLVGVAAMSAECSTTFVREITQPLVDFVQNLDVFKWRLSFIYSLMCLSNLSYFFAAVEQEEGGIEFLTQLYATLGLVLAGVLFNDDVEATVEATRVLGNISLTNVGRDWMESNRCDEVCVVFLGHEDPRVVYNCFGILLNLTAADACRVVADAELLQMLLQHTGRYTREEGIAVEKAKERMRSAGTAPSKTGAPPKKTTTISARPRVATEATTDVNYTEQIADLVEKLLVNISGLV